MNSINTYKNMSNFTLPQIYFSNQTSRYSSTNFHNSSSQTMMNQSAIPQVLSDSRCQSNDILCDHRHIDFQNSLKLKTHFDTYADNIRNLDKNEFHQNCKQVEIQQTFYKHDTIRSQDNELKARLSLDASTMTDPLTTEELERLGQWEGFAALHSDNRVAEYLTSFREFLKMSPPQEGKRRKGLGDVKIVTSSDGSRLYCCSECLMAYSDKNLLEHHLANHKVARRFICKECGAGLKRKEHLDRHLLSHSITRPYTCEVCSKTFKRNEHLVRHYVIHSGEKTHVCVECGKAFYRRDHLHNHVQGHVAKRLNSIIHAVI
ncbi:zinc finger protein 90-like [Adelges cooleyi]|uniref:zinc finger protein 90-like n=1 Tax=Adelges cooleyi TaxID=133065 RepID=UPI00217F99DC|nr:zinc finger protein 90-like [Adelges cooleyi]